MTEYKGLSGRSYRVQSAPFAGGGEGDIYDVVGVSGYVAKVYKPDKRTTERERKLSVMVSNKPNVMEQYAWPLDVLYENGRFMGYIMPKINGKEKLRNIYVYDKRKGKPWSLFIAIAKNLSAAVHNVHEIHQVIGDLNPENILVNPIDGMVTLVDTDSYHISDSSRTYRCGVGMPEFVAPELQGIHFPSAPLPTFTPESDRFALAVLIFALLMNGAHPFSCTVISGSSSKFQPIDNMQNGKCAFFPDNCSSNMNIPRYAPELSSLPDNIQKLFRRAFIVGQSNPALRPSAEEWYNALEQLENNLKTCLKDSQHIYYYGAKECPWCKVNEKMRSISQSAFNISSQSGSNSGSRPATAGGHAQQFTPSNYRYTPSPSNSGTQSSKKSYGSWIALGVAVLVLVLIIRSCASGSSSKSKKYDDVPSSTTQQSSNYQLDNSGSSDGYSQSEQASEGGTLSPTVATLSVDPIAEAPISIPAYDESEYFAESAEFLYYSGNIYESGQEDTYSFTASETGKYRCELSGMVSGFSVSMYVYDSNGNRVDYSTGISNESGVTASLTSGQTYTLCVRSSYGTGTYNVFVGMQKSAVDLSSYTIVHDDIEYKGQEIKYTYSPAVDGVYRFYIAQINNGITVSMYVYDAAGYRVDYNTGIGQNSGVTVNLESGQTYTVIVKQSSSMGNFTMNIGPQQPAVDITDYTVIADSTKYSSQTNNYIFTARETGVYRFQIDQINNGITVSLYLFDAAGYKVDYNTSIGQGSGITVSLSAGQTYLLQVKQSSNYGAYTMTIGLQKETLDISSYSLIRDSIQYNGQVNKYIFRPSSSGKYTFGIEDAMSGMQVSIYVYDDADYRINYYTGMSSGRTMSADLEANKTYYIQVRYSSDYGTYTLSVN